MAKINNAGNKFYRIYLVGIFAILFLPTLFSRYLFSPVDWGKIIMFRIILSVMLFLFVWQLLYRRNQLDLPNIKHNKIIYALGLMFLVFFLASIFSLDPYFSFLGSPLRSGGFVNFAFFIAFSIFLFLVIKNSDWRKILNFSILIGVIVAAIAILQFYGLLPNLLKTVAERPSSTSGNSIMLATYLLMLCFPAFSFLLQENKIWKRIFYGATLLSLIFGIMLAGSRAVYFGLVVGAIYFFLFIPSKKPAIKIAKISFGIILTLAILFWLSVNLNAQISKFLSQNKALGNTIRRISFSQAVDKNRIAAWSVGIKAALARPVLGYGPENFNIAFDKFYDPAIPNLYVAENDWFDRAHNAFVDAAVNAGVPGFIAYIVFFIVLLWQLHKVKYAESNADIDAENALMAHSAQAAIIAYICAIFFSFDDFSTSLILFLLVAYALHLISLNSIGETRGKNETPKIIKARGAIIGFSALLLFLFLWQYNFLPLKINSQINRAGNLADGKDCFGALSLMEKTLLSRAFLDSYARMEYVEFEKTCSQYYPQNALDYAKKGYELIKDAVKIQPYYTRYWIALGNFANTLAGAETNPETQKEMIKKGLSYFNRALELAPKRQETFIGKAKIELLAEDYASAKKDSETCISIKPDAAIASACYWYLGLSEISMNDYAKAADDIKKADKIGYNINSRDSLIELANAYGAMPDYKNLAAVFEKLIAQDPSVAQYHSSLAFFYAKLGQYKKARQEALTTLELSPESKTNVDAFLKTLPY